MYVGLGIVAFLALAVAIMWYRVRMIESRNLELHKFLKSVESSAQPSVPLTAGPATLSQQPTVDDVGVEAWSHTENV